jgi:hypothetical protein
LRIRSLTVTARNGASRVSKRFYPQTVMTLCLVWFRKGGEVSDRQWHDVLGVIRVQAGRLDFAYLREWAAQLGVADLLAKALLPQ